MRKITFFALIIFHFACNSGSSKKGENPVDTTPLNQLTKLTVTIHPRYMVVHRDTIFSQNDTARLGFVADKILEARQVKKIELRIPYPPDTAVAMPVVRVLKGSGAVIEMKPYEVGSRE